jgi:hypothetical protein
MSGSAGLASARRRRAGQANVPNSPKENQERNVPPPPNSPVDTLALLLKHNELIKKVFQEVAALKSDVKPVETDKESIDYFKQQYSSLLEEMKEIKKTLLKIQTFSMETNLEVMKLKRAIPAESDEGIKLNDINT